MTVEYKDSKRITAVSSDWTTDVTSNITWSTTGKVGWDISGTTISRTGSAGWGTSKIQSTDTFTVGNGKFMIEFSGNANDDNSTMLGFNKGTLGYYIGSPQNQNDFSIYMAGGSQVEVYESGSKNYDSGGSRSASDRYRIEIDNDGLVKYYLQAGGTGSFDLKHTSSTTASGTYFIQANAYASTSEATVHSKTVATAVAKPSNVQDNSILVEKDTANRYWKSSLEDLKTYYKFEDNGVNSATTEEGLGSSADMTVTGATYVTGKVGSKAISFDGTNDYAVIGLPSASSFNFLSDTTHEWTVAFWLKNDDFSSLGMILSTSVELGSSRYGLGIRAQSNGSMYVHFSNGTNTNRFTTTQTGFSTDGNWHFIVITAKKSDSTNSLEFWQDGVSLGTASNSGKDFVDTNASQAPYIGQAGDSSQYLDGALDELSIWNRRLSDSEIATLYNSGTGLAVDSANLREATWTLQLSLADLKAYWKMGEASGNLIDHATSIGSNSAMSADLVSSGTVNRGRTGHVAGVDCIGFPTYDADGNKVTANNSASDYGFMNKAGAKFTACWWARNYSYNNVVDLWGLGGNGNAPDINFRQRGQSGFTVWFSGTEYTGFSTPVSSNGWYFYMLSWDEDGGSNNAQLQINGTKQTATVTTTNTSNANSPLIIGDVSGNEPQMDIQEFSLWNRILTDTEIAHIYNAGVGRQL
jgi:hypothetical protein